MQALMIENPLACNHLAPGKTETPLVPSTVLHIFEVPSARAAGIGQHRRITPSMQHLLVFLRGRIAGRADFLSVR
jgi:hypothetical protein